MNVIKDRLLISNSNPRTIKEFSQNEASCLTGFEKWLSKKVGFEVEIFTIIQKQYLKCKHTEKSFIMHGKLIVGPRTYEAILNGTN